MSTKDYDFLAELEKSIAEKYGKESVQDFRSQWGPEQELQYIKQIQSKKNKTTRTPNRKTNSSRTCPLCKTYSFSGRDDLYMNRFSTCYPCYLDFVNPNLDTWEDGVRPADKLIQEILRRRKNGYSTRNN